MCACVDSLEKHEEAGRRSTESLTCLRITASVGFLVRLPTEIQIAPLTKTILVFEKQKFHKSVFGIG